MSVIVVPERIAEATRAREGSLRGKALVVLRGGALRGANADIEIPKGQDLPITYEGVPLGSIHGKVTLTAEDKPKELVASVAMPLSAQTPDGLQRDHAAQVGDLYAFVSPDKPDTVTIITTWGGPHSPADWATDAWFDPDLEYWIRIDNDGDGAAEISWTFRPFSVLTDPATTQVTGFGQVPNVSPTPELTVGEDRSPPPKRALHVLCCVWLC